MKKKLLLMALFILICLPTNTYALGKHLNIDNSDCSNVLVIGDSRMDDLGVRVNSYKKKTRYSFNATRGGHYINRKEWITGQWKELNLMISSPKYLKEQKEIVRNILRKHGSCTIIIVGTINDIDEFDQIKERKSLVRMAELRRNLLAVKVRYKGITVSPHFYVASVIPSARGKDARIKRVNAAIKKKYKSRYIDLGSYRYWLPYYTDGCHLNKKGCDILYNKISKFIKRNIKKH